MEFYIIIDSRIELILDAVREALQEERCWGDKPTAMKHCESMADYYEVRKFILWPERET